MAKCLRRALTPKEISNLWEYVSGSAIWQRLFQVMIGEKEGQEEPAPPVKKCKIEKPPQQQEAAAATTSVPQQCKSETKGEPATPPRKKRPASMFIDLSSPPAVVKPQAARRVGECKPATVLQKPVQEAPVLQAPAATRLRDAREASSHVQADVSSPALETSKHEPPKKEAVKHEPEDMVAGTANSTTPCSTAPKTRACKRREKSEVEQGAARLKEHLAKIGADYPSWQRVHRRTLDRHQRS